MNDTDRIDCLERLVNEHGGLLIHTGEESHPRLPGLGLRPGYLNRSLREAIDQLEKTPLQGESEEAGIRTYASISWPETLPKAR